MLEVKEDEKIMQLLKENPQQFEQLTESMIANKILEFTQASARIRSRERTTRSISSLKTKRVRSKSYGYSTQSR